MYGRILCALLAGGALLVPFSLSAQQVMQGEEETEEIVVEATRSGRRVQDEPIRIDVLTREEVEEKALMRPGSIATMLSETGGLRVQVTGPALGAANIRVQGMDGRFTQLLADGLPLYGGQASSLGILQVPPTDLGQVEVIKGAASALYGPSALGGVINLVSRRPGASPLAEVLLNATTRDAQDATAYVSAPLSETVGASVTGGYHRQRATDLDGDGWTDMPGYDRWTVRPRLFWEGADGAKLFVTAGAMGEDRQGGTLPGRTAPDGQPFAQEQRTDRLDGGLVASMLVGNDLTLHGRAAAMKQDHRHRFGTVVENDRHDTLFAEASIAGQHGGTSWVGGVAWQADGFRSATFPAFDYRYSVPAVFAQVEQDAATGLTLAGSARLDFHNVYGTRFSPRASLLYKTGGWTIRASGGRGFFAPTPFVEEIEAAGLSRLEPLGVLKPEIATTASLDIGYTRGPVEATATLFGSNLDNATRLDVIAPDRVRLVNSIGTTRIRGSELLLRVRHQSLVVTGSYLYVDATEPAPAGVGRQEVPLTPRHSAGMVAMWEKRDKGRVGVELYYTGKQSLEDNPYRATSNPYVELGLLGEIVLGRVRLFVNAENILDVRQTRTDRLVRPQRAADGQWTVDAWAPTDGFVLNAGIRLKFGGD